jgi:hypothetical protein
MSNSRLDPRCDLRAAFLAENRVILISPDRQHAVRPLPLDLLVLWPFPILGGEGRDMYPSTLWEYARYDPHFLAYSILAEDTRCLTFCYLSYEIMLHIGSNTVSGTLVA